MRMWTLVAEIVMVVSVKGNNRRERKEEKLFTFKINLHRFAIFYEIVS